MQSRKKADIPVYSFEKHAREDNTTTIYSPHVLILEGIFALHDQRVLDMLDLKIFAEADSDLCLSRRREFYGHPLNVVLKTNLSCKSVLRDVRERGRDIEGCIKQWFAFVKPNFHKYVEPQRHVAGKHHFYNSSANCYGNPVMIIHILSIVQLKFFEENTPSLFSEATYTHTRVLHFR